MARKSNIKSTTGSGGQGFQVTATITGAEKTSDEFKQIRRTINGKLRDAMVMAGEHSVLPAIKSGLPTRWGGTIYVRRDRGGVFIGSRLKGSMNRALGWYDFGGKRPRDSQTRRGPHVIVSRLDSERPAIDRAILRALRDAFSDFNTSFD